MVMRTRDSGATVTLFISRGHLEGLDQSQKDELAALAKVSRAEIFKIDSVAQVGEPPLALVMELGATGQSVRWATNSPRILAPGPLWGVAEPDTRFVRSQDDSELLDGIFGAVPVEPEELRRVVSGVGEITISDDLDGPVKHFGRRTWELLGERAPALLTRLERPMPLVAVEYSDRYIASPLSLLLVYRLLAELREFPGGIGPETKGAVVTSSLHQPHHTQPIYVSHDWQDEYGRKLVARSMLGAVFQEVVWEERQKRNVPHARTLNLVWSDQQKWSIRLDQGVGYWTAETRARGGLRFPFEESDHRQLQWLDAASFSVRPLTSRYPTHWFYSMGGASV